MSGRHVTIREESSSDQIDTNGSRDGGLPK